MGAILIIALVVLALIALIAVIMWRRDRSPAAEYQRNMRGIRLGTYRQTKPPHTGQVGEPQGYVGGTGPPLG
jgi:hypothetical protein